MPWLAMHNVASSTPLDQIQMLVESALMIMDLGVCQIGGVDCWNEEITDS